MVIFFLLFSFFFFSLCVRFGGGGRGGGDRAASFEVSVCLERHACYQPLHCQQFLLFWGVLFPSKTSLWKR